MVTSPSIDINLQIIPILYNLTSHTLHQSSLIIKHEKTEAMHFISSYHDDHNKTNTPITLPSLSSPITPSKQLCHLGFWLDACLSWNYHVNYYAN